MHMHPTRRSRLAILLALVVSLTSSALADVATWEKLTVAGTAVGLSSTTITPSGRPDRKACILTLETAQIRWRVDGTSPDATTGHIMDPGGAITVRGQADLSRFRAIRTGGSSGVLSVTCW